MATIAAVLIVKNEEDNLARCLQLLAGVVDELVVVDTGSTDGTLALARHFTPKVFEIAWEDDFSAARNYSLKQVESDYVLVVDGDEHLLEDAATSRALLERFVVEHAPEVLGTVERVNVLGADPQAGEMLERIPRFFRRGVFHYRGAIHEQLVPSRQDGECAGGRLRAAPTGVRLAHTGYNADTPQFEVRSLRNKALLEREVAKSPDNEYYHYQLGKTHFCLRAYAAAALAFERSLGAMVFREGEDVRNTAGECVAGEVLADLVVSLAYAYANTARLEAARDLLERHQALGHAGCMWADFHHAVGYVYLMLGDVARARRAYEEALRVGADREQVRGTGSYSSHYHLGLLAEVEGDLPMALTCYLRALQAKPDYAVALSRCVDLVVEQGIALPALLWDVADRRALGNMFAGRLGDLLATGQARQAAQVVEAARRLSGDLLSRCLEMCQDRGLDAEALRKGLQ